MIRPLYMVLCDYAFRDENQKWGFLGIFHFIILDGPEDEIPPFKLAFGFTMDPAVQPGKLRFLLKAPDGAQHRLGNDIDLGSPPEIAEATFPGFAQAVMEIRRVPWHGAGTYIFQAFEEDRLVLECPCQILLEGEGHYQDFSLAPPAEKNRDGTHSE